MKILAAVLGVTGLLAAQADEAGALRDRLDRYLSAYEPQLSALVADEEMTQRTTTGGSRQARGSCRRDDFVIW